MKELIEFLNDYELHEEIINKACKDGLHESKASKWLFTKGFYAGLFFTMGAMPFKDNDKLMLDEVMKLSVRINEKLMSIVE